MRPHFRCVIHGSLRKHLREMGQAIEIFQQAGIEVLAPQMADIVKEQDGFLFFKGEERSDPRLIELLYLQNLRRLGRNGFSYFVNPGGYIGKSVSYELGVAQTHNVRCFFQQNIVDHPAYIEPGNVWSAESLAEYITRHHQLPGPRETRPSQLNKLWQQLFVPGSVVATGAVIEYRGSRSHEPEILMVRTHKWHNRFSMVGGKVRRGERLTEALRREVKEETGLDASIGEHICTFDQIQHSGYYDSGIQHVFVDNVVRVDRKNVVLNEEAQEYVWLPPRQALAELPIEPNARHTLQLYWQEIYNLKK